MANVAYNSFKKELITEGHNITAAGDAIRLYLSLESAVDQADDAVNDLSLALLTSVEHTGEELDDVDSQTTAGTVTAVCPSITGVDEDQTIYSVVVGNPAGVTSATAKLVCYIDSGTNLGAGNGLLTNGNDVDVTVGTLLSY